MFSSGLRQTYRDPALFESVFSTTSVFRNSGAFVAATAFCVGLAGCSAHDGGSRASIASVAPGGDLATAAAGASVQPTSLQTSVSQTTAGSTVGAGRLSVGQSSAALATRPAGTVAQTTPNGPRRAFGRSGAGLASWYGDRFHGRATANGESFDARGFTAAHRSFPLPSYVRVTNVQNGRSIVVRVNDRGPFHGGRVIDVSSRAADVLGFKSTGVGAVKLDLVGRAPESGSDDRKLLASYQEFGRPAAAPGMQMAMAPVSDSDLAAETSGGGAFAMASAAVTRSVAIVKSSAVAMASTAVVNVLPATTAPTPRPAAPEAFAASAPATPTASSPDLTPVAYAAPQPLIAGAPSAIVSAKPAGKRTVAPAEPVLASAGPPAAAVKTFGAALGPVDISSRIAAGFDGF